MHRVEWVRETWKHRLNNIPILAALRPGLQYRWRDRMRVIMPLILSLEKATVFSQGREPLGPSASRVRPAPEGRQYDRRYCRPSGAGRSICGIPVQGLTPLANNCRPVPGLGTTRLDAQNRRKVILSLIITRNS